MMELSYGLEPSGLYRHLIGLGYTESVTMVGDLEYPHRQACLPRQGKSHPDTGRSLQSCIFIVQESDEGIVRLPEPPLIQDSLTAQNNFPCTLLGKNMLVQT